MTSRFLPVKLMPLCSPTPILITAAGFPGCSKKDSGEKFMPRRPPLIFAVLFFPIPAICRKRKRVFTTGKAPPNTSLLYPLHAGRGTELLAFFRAGGVRRNQATESGVLFSFCSCRAHS